MKGERLAGISLLEIVENLECRPLQLLRDIIERNHAVITV